MLFTIFSTGKSLRRAWKMNVLIVLTLYVAYLFFFLVCCYIEDGLLGLSSFQLADRERGVLYQGRAPFGGGEGPGREDIASLLGDAAVESAAVVEYATYDDPAAGQSYSFFLVDENFTGHFQAPIVAGRYFTQEELLSGAPVCVTNQQSYYTGGPGPGDVISLGGIDVEVVGVMKYVPNAGAKLLPYRLLEGKPRPNFTTQHWYAAVRFAGAPPKIEFDSLGLEESRRFTGEEYYQTGRKSLLGRSAAVLLAGLCILAYALLNLLNILVNKLDQQQKSLGIRVALGAGYGKIFLQFFLECLVLVLWAVALVFASEPAIGPVAWKYFNHFFGPLSVFTMLAVSGVSALFISWRLLGRFRKMNVTDMIKKL